MMTNQRNALTTVVSYPERGEGGNNKYRGNCSTKLIEDLIAHFGVQEICDYMCGSNTGAAGVYLLASAILGYHQVFGCHVPGSRCTTAVRL